MTWFVGKGSTFTVRLPVNPGTPRASVDKNPAPFMSSPSVSPRATSEVCHTCCEVLHMLSALATATQGYADDTMTPVSFCNYSQIFSFVLIPCSGNC